MKITSKINVTIFLEELPQRQAGMYIMNHVTRVCWCFIAKFKKV